MTIAAVCRPIADASVSIAAAYKPIAAEQRRHRNMKKYMKYEIYELTLLTVVHS